jgi:UDP-N-acetylmuramoyl-L-alanyl-D-glutamate--2,6-diaminopimelate ligase
MIVYGTDGRAALINDITYDSRKADSGLLFACLRGAVVDGHKYARDAYQKGCRAFLCEETLDLPPDAVQIVCTDTRTALAEYSAQLFGYPAKKLKLIGITGTKGKTSTAYFIRHILNSVGTTGMIGTNGIFYGDVHIGTVNSTPESYILHSTFADMLAAGVKSVVMEVSSQAVKTRRVHGIEFDSGVFTNLSPDHIGVGEHLDFDEYKQCKSELFSHADYSVINADDENAAFMAARAKAGSVCYYSVKDAGADYTAANMELWRSASYLGVSYDLRVRGVNRGRISMRIPGGFTVYNSLAAIAVCHNMGVDFDTIREALAVCTVDGRFEIVAAEDKPSATFIIDYAHNELSLKSALETIRAYSPARIVCLFGAVGGRTQMRREGLGRIAGKLADFCILTADNPDNENPLDVIADIERGLNLNPNPPPYTIIPDRSVAVRYAVENARDGDIILLAGKGDEDFQLINGVRVPFSERDLIAGGRGMRGTGMRGTGMRGMRRF